MVGKNLGIPQPLCPPCPLRLISVSHGLAGKTHFCDCRELKQGLIFLIETVVDQLFNRFDRFLFISTISA